MLFKKLSSETLQNSGFVKEFSASKNNNNFEAVH